MLSVFAVVLSGFTLVARTPRADYYTLDKHLRIDVKTCESFIAKTEKKLGIVLPHFEYYRVAGPQDIFRLSVDHHYSGGVANPDPLYVIAMEPCYKHELVHLMTYRLGRASLVFEEGIASLLADDYGLEDRLEAKRLGRRLKLRYGTVNRSFRDYTGSTGDLHVQYLVSEEFVRHLVHERGLERFLADAYTGADFGEQFDEWLYGRAAP
ncbi:MAG TPA: hypothetical protein VMU12_00815 [Candidatus Paceibacterota bacterium]|nr:hypothetical protein [Candidatus Paceibacterota bacterium]